MQYCSWDIVHDRCDFYFSFCAIFCPFTPLAAQKFKNFLKNERSAGRYHHFTYVYKKLWSDDVWFLRYGARRTDGQMGGLTDRQKKWNHSFLQGWNPPFLREPPPPPFWVPPSFWSKLKKLPPSFWEPSKLVHVSCMKHLKWRCYVLYYTKSIENIVLITLYTLRLNSVFTTDICFG